MYDGQRLPRLYRIVNPGTGHTIAYVRPDQGYDMTGLLGQVVGVAGEKAYDGGLRLTLVTPRRIDMLSPSR